MAGTERRLGNARTFGARVLAPTVGVLLLGFTVTLAAAVLVEHELDRTAQQTMDRRAELVRQAVATEVERYEDTLALVAASLGSGPSLTRLRFDEAVAPLRDMDLAGAPAVFFLAPPVGDDEVAPLQRRWRTRGATGLELRPTEGYARHVFTVLSLSLDDSEDERTGIDVAGAAVPLRAILDSADQRRTTISTPYRLLIDAALPPEQRQQSFSIVTPVWSGAGSDELRGWLLLGIRGQDFVGGVMADAGQGVVSATLQTPDEDGTMTRVAAAAADDDDPADLRRVSEVPVAQRTWTVVTQGSSGRLVPALRYEPWAILLVGMLATCGAALLVRSLATGRSAAQREAREADEKLHHVTTRLEDLIWSAAVEPGGALRLTFVNTTAAQALGVVPPAEGENLADFLQGRATPADLPRVRGFLDQLRLGVAAQLETRVVADDGTERWVWARGFPRTDGDRTLVDGIIADIHRRKVLDQQRTQFLSIAGHEIRTPLTIIRGYAEYLLAEDLDPVARRTSLDAIRRRAQQMEGLLEEFFDVSRMESGGLSFDRVTVDLAEITAAAVQERREHGDGLGLRWVSDLTPVPVEGDPQRLRQVVDHLLDNASRYSEPGGEVRVSCAAVDRTARLEVADQGIGVPADELPLIFDRFYRASNAERHSASGTGLGLSVVAAVVDGHDGAVTAAPAEGGGLVVRVTLPLSPHRTDVEPGGQPADDVESCPQV